MSRFDSWDESRVRVRPNPKGNRPRTKDRPAHAQAVEGRVVTVDRGRYTALVDEGLPGERMVLAVRAKELRRQPVVPGDRVALVGDTSGAGGSLARLVRIGERAAFLRRSADDTDPVERVLVANVDQLVIVTAAANPEPRTGLIDRALVAAYDAGIDPVLCVTKTDLGVPDVLVSHYGALEVPILTVGLGPDGSHTPAGLESVRNQLAGLASVFVGHSGVGKSTLVNALTGSERATGGVNDVTGRGRHTSSSAVMLRLPGGGWIIDTPGIRSFGLAHVDNDRILEAFEDLAPATADCEKGCRHDRTAVNCGIDALLAARPEDHQLALRADSLRRLLSGALARDSH